MTNFPLKKARSPNVTDWYPGAKQPVRIGVYQRCHSRKNGCDRMLYAYWDGRRWGKGKEEIADLVLPPIIFSKKTKLNWRGLMENPEPSFSKKRKHQVTSARKSVDAIIEFKEKIFELKKENDRLKDEVRSKDREINKESWKNSELKKEVRRLNGNCEKFESILHKAFQSLEVKMGRDEARSILGFPPIPPNGSDKKNVYPIYTGYNMTKNLLGLPG